MINKILLAILLTVSAVPAAAAAQERPIKLESDVKLLRQVQQGDAPELVAPEGVVPGDTLVFTTSYRNEGASAVKDFVIVNPVPTDLVLTDEAATATEVSVDGGAHWGRLAELKIVDADSQERPATAGDITHMRWVFASVAPSANGEVKFSARVR
jgi:uncharacterized repeat protein (TIGR01451 family)